jgi:hypothetical protein
VLAATLLAEWHLVRRRLLRTRLGIWLLVLSTGTALVLARSDVAPAGPAARLALLAAMFGVTFCAASGGDRAALPLLLSHPTTPAALAAGRATVTALLAFAGVVAALAAALPVRAMGIGPALAAAATGAGAAAAGAGAALACAWLGGNVAVGLLLAWVAIVGNAPPELWRAAAPDGAVAVAGVVLLEALPGVWRYRSLATGDVVAWLHALAWGAGGVALAAWRLDRRLR